MDDQDHVCLCFKVPLCKIRSYLEREDPPKASLISEVLSAGTGCHWCVPFLEELHRRHKEGEPVDLAVSPEAYANARKTFKKDGERHMGPDDLPKS